MRPVAQLEKTAGRKAEEAPRRNAICWETRADRAASVFWGVRLLVMNEQQQKDADCNIIHIVFL